MFEILYKFIYLFICLYICVVPIRYLGHMLMIFHSPIIYLYSPN